MNSGRNLPRFLEAVSGKHICSFLGQSCQCLRLEAVKLFGSPEGFHGFLEEKSSKREGFLMTSISGELSRIF